MQKKIVLKNGKKYIVNVVGWEDGNWNPDPNENLLIFISGSTQLQFVDPTGIIDQSSN